MVARWLIMLGLAIVCLAAPFGGSAMAKELVLASPLSGRLVHGTGAPAAGVRVRREWHWLWGDKRGTDSVETDDAGRFRFAEVTRSSFWASILPHEPSTWVRVFAEREDGDVKLLAVQKRDYERGWEARAAGRPGAVLRLVCELDGVDDAEDSLFFGSCRWDDD